MAAVLLVAAGAGCGGSSPVKPQESPPAREVRVTVEAWLASLAVGHVSIGDNARACAYLTPALRRSIDQQLRMRGETTNCKTFAANWTGGSNPPGRRGAHVTAVKVTGATAEATLRAPPDRESQVKLRRMGGRWLIDNY